MSVTIDSLDIQIRSSAGTAAANIDRLADSLKRLRENGKLTVVSNNLQRLSTALASLQSASTGLSNLRGLAGAMKALASVQKSAGLNSILNSLRKLPEIINALDASMLSAFSAGIRQLAEGLRPLSTELERVGTAFSRLPARVQQLVTATNRLTVATRAAEEAQEDHGEELDATRINMAAGIDIIQAYMGALTGLRDAMTAVISDAIEWDGIQFRFGRAFGEDAEEVYEYILKINEALHINTQQFMQYSSLYGSLLAGFGLQQEKITAISVGLTELSYDIWAAHNDRFKTLEDASEAVRSAITGEIEPIRNAGIALTEASMQEYLDNLGLAHVRMANLSEAQKSQVRYAVMVNSAMNQGIVGTYAAEMDTAEGAVRTLSQQMKSLGQAIGSIFIPILAAVVPWISAFVEVLYDAVAALAAVFNIPFFEVSWAKPFRGADKELAKVANTAGGAGKAIGGAAKEAKKLQDYTMGFDELNIIDPPSDSAGSGGSGGGAGAGGAGTGSDWEGLDLDTLWDDSVFAKAAKQVDELKQRILDWMDRWKAEIAIVSVALATLSIAGLLTKLGTALQWGDNFLGVMSRIKKMASTAIVITLGFGFAKASFSKFMSDEGSFWDYVAGLLIGGAATWVLYSQWGAGGLAIGFGVTAFAALSAVIENGGINSVESASVALTGLASAVAAVWLGWKKLVPAIANSALADSIRAIIGAFRGSSAASSALTFMFPTITKIATALVSAGKAVGAFLAGISAPVWGVIAAIIAVIASVALFLARNWDKVKEAAKNFFKENIVPKLESMKESWEKIKDALSPLKSLFKKISEPVKELAKSFGEWWDKVDPLKEALEWLGDALEIVGGIIFGVFSGVLAGAFSAIMGVIDGFVQAFSGIIQIISGVIQFIIALFTGGDVQAAVDLMISGIVDLFKGLWKMISAPIIEMWNGVVDWFWSLWDELVGHSIVPDMIDAIVDWFLSLPGKIFGAVEDFCKGIADKFKNLWSDIKTWWNSDVAPKFTKAYWEAKFDVIRSAIGSKLDAVKTAASQKWTELKSWFSKDVAAKFTLSYWQTKFDVIKSAISTKLQEVKQKAAEKWTEIKEWFSANVAPKFTLKYWTEKFGSIKDALIAAIKGGINGAVSKLNSFINWLNEHLKITLPAVSVAGKEVFAGASFTVMTIPNIPKFADGGFIEDGLFTMNRGEIAGKFTGGKSVVANNQMIVEGIAAGVYSAVVAAMNDTNGGNSQNINVYLDGKQIYASIKKTEAERGVQLMGNQLGYSY